MCRGCRPPSGLCLYHDLFNNNLTRIPSHLTNSIEYLDVSHNNISSIVHGDLSGLTNLCFLKVTHCGLQYISPDAFSSNSEIKVLNISYNHLTVIPNLHLPQLRILDLSTNLYPSYALPGSFGNLIISRPIKTDPFMAFNDLRALSNLSILDTWLNSSGIRIRISFIVRYVNTYEEFVFVTKASTVQQNAVMVKLFKNFWKSSFEETVFLNITYNEDTTDGFRLPKQNRTTNLQAFVLDGVHRHQYHYPTFNVSMELVNKLTFLKFSGTGMSILPCNLISAIKFLQVLDLSNNLLDESVFPALRNLSLSHNRCRDLTEITKNVNDRKFLESLDLSFNSYFHWQTMFLDLQAPMLVSLHIDQNAITCISQKSMEGFPKLRSLKAGHKPFSCDCDSFWFMMVYNKSLLSDWSQDNSCSTPPSFSGRRLETYEHGWLSCQLGLQAAVVLSVLSVVVVALAIIVYACDGIWYTKMLWGWIRVKRRGYKRADRLLNATFRYHAFISYSQHDSTWVGSQLVPELERSGLSLCVHERDFEPGKWIVDNIIHCVEDSYKSLFILAKHFVQSELCNYELFFAQHRAISVNDDSLVFVLLEHIPTDSLPKKFLKLRILLRRKTYLEWPTDERKQRVFWGNLKAILQTVDQSKILKDVATDIAEMCPLVSVKE
uniref:TIR domain-containing protein n=1 Tax=Sinocyclocheilus grahami TaxID=75366 RepID=A0A672JXE6_SINGR